MTKMVWGLDADRIYETGLDRVAFFLEGEGFPWNGVTSIEESNDRGSEQSFYLDGIKYLSFFGFSDFKASLTAVSKPAEFDSCDGIRPIALGLFATQQRRQPFDFSYRTLIGDAKGTLGENYKIHLVYNATAAPTSYAHETLSDEVSPQTLSWEISTIPIEYPGIRPTAHFVVDTRYLETQILSYLEDVLYGTTEQDPYMPRPDQLVVILDGETIEY